MVDPQKKRNLPSWTTSRTPTSSNKNPPVDDEEQKTAPAGSSSQDFSKLLEGVVFALSGFVNPERAALRSEALEMGAEYRPDWGPDCTLLVCAYSNTPKFRQVESLCGTIVSKDWVHQCYQQRKLLEIDSYLMFPGKPWRKGSVDREKGRDQNTTPTGKSAKQVERGSHLKAAASSSAKSNASTPTKERFSPSKVKEWAIDDMNRTVSWLESQDEKPAVSEIKQIAAEGVLLCLQDTIDSFEQNQDVHGIVDQWMVVPRAVEELVKLVDGKTDSASFSEEDVCRRAKEYKQIYDNALGSFCDLGTKDKRQKTDEIERKAKGRINDSDNAADYDSDETIEMTEEEIDMAYNRIALHDD